MDNKIFKYNGTDITFQLGDGTVMVNATEMAKPFEKIPNNWLQLPSTKSFLEILKTSRKSISLIQTIEGRGGGTWIHEDVAIEFARWLAPEFGIWCNDRIKELLTKGSVYLSGISRKQLCNMVLDEIEAKEIAEKKAIGEKVRADLNEHKACLANGIIRENAPKVEYYEDVLSSNSDFTSTVVAKGLGLKSAIELHKRLHARGIMYKIDKTWVLFSNYCKLGYTEIRTYSFMDGRGDNRTEQITTWTEKGREFLHGLNL